MGQGELSKRSCDYCRQHKTKCIRLEDATCRRCSKARRACVTSNVKTGRPYYQSSKEQYDLMSTIVKHFLPDAALDKESLRQLVTQLHQDDNNRGSDDNNDNNTTPDNNTSSAAGSHHQPPIGVVNADLQSPLPVTALVENSLLTSAETTVQLPPFSRRFPDQTMSEPYPQLHGCPDGMNQGNTDLGPVSAVNLAEYACHYPISAFDVPQTCSPESARASWTSETEPAESMARAELMNVTRYDSGTSWTAFFRKIHSTKGPTYGDALGGSVFRFDELTGSKQVDQVQPNDLPPRAEFERASLRFFAEINCVNYILSYEQFYVYISDSLDQRHPLSHGVFMLLCLILSFDSKYEEFFSKACGHVEYVFEEGSIASVESLMLLALCRLNRDQRNLAWITLGSASRIAQSLGLHLKESCWEEKSPSIVESRKRLWWSLYDLEICLAYRLGRNPGINPAFCSLDIPSQAMLNMTPYTPPDYHRAVAQLSKINCLIVQDLYGPRAAQICLDSRADEILSDIQCFWNRLHDYLKPGAPLAASHSRAVHYLGLRYEYTILVATRPSMVSCWKFFGSCSDRLMQRVQLCEAANRRSLLLLKRMARDGLFSQHNFLDATYVLANALILLLRLVKDPSRELLTEAEEYCLLIDMAQHLNIGRVTKRHFEETTREIRSRLGLGGELRTPRETSVSELLENFMGVDECIWPTWPFDDVAELDWSAAIP
ncbi:hypothetical protein PV05_09305 [Exophiala xenobiotica]|uniref:Zn(2)-C6 fungal-type domain-containing protein n=1 Tax=Exophiala xenobiotica TaxID=348802 RepID=A0A0D2BED0_9EURO|nr:uncharacterized protein PV05_09305 [Exophiala xenobiotica]KIW50501.1 hypothetical protein PV05_09305 [Exophiala xenobiotica]